MEILNSAIKVLVESQCFAYLDCIRCSCAMNSDHLRQEIDLVYRRDARRVFAALVRLLGGFDLAEKRCMRPFGLHWSSGRNKAFPAIPRHG